jgi:hypothetical protein
MKAGLRHFIKMQLLVLAPICFLGCWSSQNRSNSNLSQYLAKDLNGQKMNVEIPKLKIPARVGIDFIPFVFN